MRARRFEVCLFASLFVVACGDDESGSTGGAGGSIVGGGAVGGSTGGTPAAGGMGGTSTGGVGGDAGGGGAGGTGGGACTPVSIGAFILSDTEAGGSSLAYELDGLDPMQDHALFIEFYDLGTAQEAISYDLSMPPNDNYETCAQCLLAFVDLNGTSTPYYPVAGTLQVTTADTGYTGESAGQIMQVELAEVTLNGTTTVPVPGGDCLLLTGSWDALP